MSNNQILNYFLKKYAGNSIPKRSFRKVIKYTGVAIAGGGLAAFPSVSDIDNAGNIVTAVNGGIRFLRCLKLGTWISMDYYFSMLGLNESSPNYKAMMGRIHQRSADNILEGCLQNGGSYIKLGQGLVSLSHILPKEYIHTLKALQDKCLARGDNEIKQIFFEDFGKDPLDIYKSFENKPIAAASIAQVYEATTKNDEKVAVKVQYIDLQKRFISDVLTIKTLLKIAAFIHPNFNFAWILGDLENALKQELDFINEGRNGERCAEDLRHLEYIHIPKVFWDYTSSRILVTEFIDGFKIDDVKNLRKSGHSLADINNKLFEAFGHQIFQTGFVHADPHPGNILIRTQNTKTQLVLLDHGLYQYVPDNTRIALSHMWKAIVLNDHIGMKKYSNQLGVENYELFAEILTQCPLKTTGFRLRAKLTNEDLQRMTEFARDRFDSIIGCLQSMPPTLMLVIRNLNTIRAIAHEHGNPIDRYTVLARVAARRAYSDRSTITKTILNLPLWLYFETILIFNRIGTWLRKRIMVVLYRLGMIPDVESIMAAASDLNY